MNYLTCRKAPDPCTSLPRASDAGDSGCAPSEILRQMTAKKKPSRRGNGIIPHFPLLVKGFFSFFLQDQRNCEQNCAQNGKDNAPDDRQATPATVGKASAVVGASRSPSPRSVRRSRRSAPRSARSGSEWSPGSSASRSSAKASASWSSTWSRHIDLPFPFSSCYTMIISRNHAIVNRDLIFFGDFFQKKDCRTFLSLFLLAQNGALRHIGTMWHALAGYGTKICCMI